METKSQGICEMCGHYVAIRHKAHIVAEAKKEGNNILMLCPTCNIMFDTHIKPKIFGALVDSGASGFPVSWKRSIDQQAAEPSATIRDKQFME